MWRAEDPRALEPAAFWRKLKWEGPSPRAGIRPPKTFSFLLLPPVLGNRGSPKGVERGSQSKFISYMVSLSLEVFKTQLYNTMTRSHVVMSPTLSRSLAWKSPEVPSTNTPVTAQEGEETFTGIVSTMCNPPRHECPLPGNIPCTAPDKCLSLLFSHQCLNLLQPRWTQWFQH